MRGIALYRIRHSRAQGSKSVVRRTRIYLKNQLRVADAQRGFVVMDARCPVVVSQY